MGLFKDPRRAEGDTKATFARRRAPWLVVVALVSTYYVFTLPHPNGTTWMAMALVWVAAILACASADWSDLRK